MFLKLNSERIEQKLIFNLVKIILSQEQCNQNDYEELLIKISEVHIGAVILMYWYWKTY